MARRHLILGIGVVTTQPFDEEGLAMTQIKTIGAAVSTTAEARFSLGYSHYRIVTVSENAEDVRAEVHHEKGGGTVMTIQRVELSDDQPIEKEDP